MIGHLIYNYCHLDDARILMEISKNFYAKKFKGVYLVHAYNGKTSFGYKKYLEDQLIKIENRGHFKGASDLINIGLEFFTKNEVENLQYIIITAADTWILNLKFLENVIDEMKKENKVLAASSWGKAKYPEKLQGFSTDFFIIDIRWNRKNKLFPLNYDGFVKKFCDFFYLNYSQPILETAVQYAFQKYFADNYADNDIWRMRNKKFRRIIEREPVHKYEGTRQSSWPSLGLYTSPEPQEKKKILTKLNYDFGYYSHKLIYAKNLDYYNNVKYK